MKREAIYNLNSITIQGMIKKGQIPDPSFPGNEDLFYYGNGPTISKCDQYGNDIPGTTRRLEDENMNPTQGFNDIHGRNIFTQQGTGLFNPVPQFATQGQPSYHQQMYNPNMMNPMMYQQQAYTPNMIYQQPNYGYQYQQQIPQGFGYPTSIPQSPIGFEYNPFMAGSQYSLYEAQLRERKREESEIWKLCARASTHYAGLEITDEEIDKIFDPDRQLKEYQKKMEDLNNQTIKPFNVIIMYGDEEYIDPEFANLIENEKIANNGISVSEQKAKMKKDNPAMFGKDIRYMYQHIQGLLERAVPFNMNIAIANAQHNYIYDKQKEKYPDSMGLYDFLDHTHEMWINMLEREHLAAYGGKLNLLYDSDEFRKNLLNPNKAMFNPNSQCNYPVNPNSGFGLSFMSENGRMFANNKEYSDYTGMSYNPDLGCMEVTVPERIRKHHTTFDEARQKFLSSIVNQRR